MLKKTIELYCINQGYEWDGKSTLSEEQFEGYYIDLKKGFILIRYGVEANKGQVKFPAPVNIDIAAGMVYAWIHSKESKGIPMEGWDADADHDGSNELGWRVYCDNWGHIETDKGSIYSGIAIKPAYMWYGK